MPGSGNNGTVRTLVRLLVRALSRSCLYGAPARGRGEDDVRHRLAESVFQRCQQLASDPARRDCPRPFILARVG